MGDTWQKLRSEVARTPLWPPSLTGDDALRLVAGLLLYAALIWLQGTLLGNVATAVAVMAVAAVGFMMLTGRMNWRFGATVIIGVFILFGATTIVAGIQSAAG